LGDEPPYLCRLQLLERRVSDQIQKRDDVTPVALNGMR